MFLGQSQHIQIQVTAQQKQNKIYMIYFLLLKINISVQNNVDANTSKVCCVLSLKCCQHNEFSEEAPWSRIRNDVTIVSMWWQVNIR